MKHWILTFFRLSLRLKKPCMLLDKQIARLSVNLTREPQQLVEAILILLDKKRRIVNFKVLVKRMSAELSADDRAFIRRHAFGETLTDIGLECGISPSTASRRLQRILEQCADVLTESGFSFNRLIRDYGDIPFIFNTVRELIKTDRGNRAESPTEPKAVHKAG